MHGIIAQAAGRLFRGVGIATDLDVAVAGLGAAGMDAQRHDMAGCGDRQGQL
jgi:hypothetical protein